MPGELLGDPSAWSGVHAGGRPTGVFDRTGFEGKAAHFVETFKRLFGVTDEASASEAGERASVATEIVADADGRETIEMAEAAVRVTLWDRFLGAIRGWKRASKIADRVARRNVFVGGR